MLGPYVVGLAGMVVIVALLARVATRLEQAEQGGCCGGGECAGSCASGSPGEETRR